MHKLRGEELLLPLSSLSEKYLLEKLLTLQFVSSVVEAKRGADLSTMLSSHRFLCPCVINPKDNSSEFKKLIYFNKRYQVRHMTFVTGLMSSSY